MNRRKRKTKRASWTQDQMEDAINAVKDGLPIRIRAARDCGVSKDALHRRIKNKNKKAKMALLQGQNLPVILQDGCKVKFSCSGVTIFFDDLYLNDLSAFNHPRIFRFTILV